jgi:hypothetical protein
MKRFIALGFTSGRCSIELIDRYKTSEDLRDIFVLNERQVARAVRRRLYVFEVCEEPRADCLYLVSFDIRLVKPVNPEKASREYRKPSHEYRHVREMLYYMLCLGGKDVLDNSTYLCFDDVSSMVSGYLRSRTDPDKFRVETYLVRPYRDTEKQLIVNGLSHTLDWLEAQAMALRSPRSRKARERAELIAVPASLVAKVAEKLKALGIDPEPFMKRISSVREAAERVLKEREAEGESTAVGL